MLNLFNKTISLESLLDAWDEFKLGKGKRIDVQIFEQHLSDNLFKLHGDLVSKKYKHGPYHSFYIRDPKLRLIHKSSVRDRIVHHTVFKTLNEIFEPTFIDDSYSCRENKGSHRAVRRLKAITDVIYRRYRKCFVLKCDIKKFFHSINHAILLQIIKNKIKDDDMLCLTENLVHSFSAQIERERERE